MQVLGGIRNEVKLLSIWSRKQESERNYDLFLDIIYGETKRMGKALTLTSIPHLISQILSVLTK